MEVKPRGLILRDFREEALRAEEVGEGHLGRGKAILNGFPAVVSQASCCFSRPHMQLFPCHWEGNPVCPPLALTGLVGKMWGRW